MSEEEKKAIEFMEEYKDVVYRIPFKTILNLIDKQQKEIEEFRGIKNGTTIIYKGKAKYVREDKINKYYISKDKIKEIIKKYAEEDVITYKELTDLVAELNDLAY